MRRPLVRIQPGVCTSPAAGRRGPVISLHETDPAQPGVAGLQSHDRGPSQVPTTTPSKGGRPMSYLSTHPAAPDPAVRAAAAGPGPQLAPAGTRGPSTSGRGCAASSSSAPRAGASTPSEATLTRENAAAVEDCLGRDGAADGRGDRRGQRRAARAEERPGLFALAMAAGLGDEPTRRAALAALPRRLPHRHAPVPLRDVRRGVPRLGPRAAPGGRRVVHGAHAGRARLPGGQVPPARRRVAPRPAAPRPPGRRTRRQPDARRHA